MRLLLAGFFCQDQLNFPAAIVFHETLGKAVGVNLAAVGTGDVGVDNCTEARALAVSGNMFP